MRGRTVTHDGNLIDIADRLTGRERAVLRALAREPMRYPEIVRTVLPEVVGEVIVARLHTRALIAEPEPGLWQITGDGLKVIEILETLERLGR